MRIQLLILASLLAGALDHGLLVGQTVSVETNGPRSLHVAARALEAAYGWRITHEDPPFAASDTVPVAPNIPFLVPRGKRAVLTFHPPNNRTSPVEKERVMGELLRQHIASGNPGIFTARANGDFIHVVPTARVDENGNVVPYESLLSTPVTFSSADRTVGQIVELVLQQVATTRNVKIVQGLAPSTMYLNEHQVREAKYETAENVLIRTFEFASHTAESRGAGPRRVTWDLLYDPNEQKFYFSAHVLAEPTNNTAAVDKKIDNHPRPSTAR